MLTVIIPFRPKAMATLSGRVKLKTLSGTGANQISFGGGYLTNKVKDIREIEDVYIKKKREKRIKEIEILNNKIVQLNNFDLGLSSV